MFESLKQISDVKKEIKKIALENGLTLGYITTQMSRADNTHIWVEHGIYSAKKLVKKSKEYRQAVYNDIITDYKLGKIQNAKRIKTSWRNAGPKPLRTTETSG